MQVKLVGLLAGALLWCAGTRSEAEEHQAPIEEVEGEETTARAAVDPELDVPADEAAPDELTDSAGESTSYRYSADLDDAELEKTWENEPERLGALSIGFAGAGRLVNGVPFPEGPLWTILDPSRAYTTEEIVEYLSAAIAEVNDAFDETPRLRIGHISRKGGGRLRPHSSHQAGRDVDLCFYELEKPTARGDRFDLPRNWALLRALVTNGDVQFILVDKRLQKKLFEYAVSIGEDREWLDSLFRAGPESLMIHARRHRDHFHVRYFSPRAQELGRRVHPLLAKGGPGLKAVHRVQKGENLKILARRYETTISAIRRANGLGGLHLRSGMTLQIPLGRSCPKCPLPPKVVVPPRRLPPSKPELLVGWAEAGAASARP